MLDNEKVVFNELNYKRVGSISSSTKKTATATTTNSAAEINPDVPPWDVEAVQNAPAQKVNLKMGSKQIDADRIDSEEDKLEKEKAKLQKEIEEEESKKEKEELK